MPALPSRLSANRRIVHELQRRLPPDGCFVLLTIRDSVRLAKRRTIVALAASRCGGIAPDSAPRLFGHARSRFPYLRLGEYQCSPDEAADKRCEDHGLPRSRIDSAGGRSYLEEFELIRLQIRPYPRSCDWRVCRRQVREHPPVRTAKTRIDDRAAWAYGCLELVGGPCSTTKCPARCGIEEALASDYSRNRRYDAAFRRQRSHRIGNAFSGECGARLGDVRNCPLVKRRLISNCPPSGSTRNHGTQHDDPGTPYK